MPSAVAISSASDQSLLVSFGGEVTSGSHGAVLSLFYALEKDPVLGIVNLQPGYCSLLVRFDPMRIDSGQLERLVRGRLQVAGSRTLADRQTVTIPVCYDEEFGLDLEEVARLHAISRQDVVDLHTSGTYTVYFLGFVPGFAYLGMLPERLATPRLAAPRKQVPARSVGIADRQTGVYPLETPGGWRLLGRTPVAVFDAGRPGMSLLQPGDLVRFQPISRSEFDAAGTA